MGTVPIMAAEEIEYRFGPRSAVQTTGRGASYLQNIGESPDIIRITAFIEKSFSKDFASELKRTEPILLSGDPVYTPLTEVYAAGTVYASPIMPMRHVSSDMVDHRAVEMMFYVWGDTANYSRSTKTSNRKMPNTFDMDGSVVVPLPIGASSVSETVDGTRVTAYGTVTTVESPSISTVKYSVSEANLRLGGVTYTRSTNEHVFENGLIKVQSRNDESTNKGMWDFSCYMGTAWTTVGTLEFGVNTTAGTAEYLTGAPEVEVLFNRRNPEKETLVITYPSSTTNSWKGRVHLTMFYGKPFVQTALTNWGTNSLGETRVRVNMAATTYVNFTGAGTTLNAGSATYGGTVISGTADTYNYSYLHTVNPIGTTSYEVGFIRTKKADSYHIPNDAGAFFDSITQKMDNMEINPGDIFPQVYVFAQYQNATGATPAYLAQEVVRELHSRRIVVRKT